MLASSAFTLFWIPYHILGDNCKTLAQIEAVAAKEAMRDGSYLIRLFKVNSTATVIKQVVSSAAKKTSWSTAGAPFLMIALTMDGFEN